MRYKHAVGAAALGLTLVLAGCGSNSDDSNAGDDSADSSTSQAASFNEADVAFTQQMIPHHRQAVMMADLAETQAASPKVKTLASDIAAAQGPEIQTMTGWLKDWGEPVSPDMAGMDHGSMSEMPGMMSDEQMQELEKLSGPKFDKAFLSMMIGHHKGAIAMAETEQEDGSNTDAVELAEQIEKAQAREIKTMKSMLNS